MFIYIALETLLNNSSSRGLTWFHHSVNRSRSCFQIRPEVITVAVKHLVNRVFLYRHGHHITVIQHSLSTGDLLLHALTGHLMHVLRVIHTEQFSLRTREELRRRLQTKPGPWPSSSTVSLGCMLHNFTAFSSKIWLCHLKNLVTNHPVKEYVGWPSCLPTVLDSISMHTTKQIWFNNFPK